MLKVILIVRKIQDNWLLPNFNPMLEMQLKSSIWLKRWHKLKSKMKIKRSRTELIIFTIIFLFFFYVFLSFLILTFSSSHLHLFWIICLSIYLFIYLFIYYFCLTSITLLLVEKTFFCHNLWNFLKIISPITRKSFCWIIWLALERNKLNYKMQMRTLLIVRMYWQWNIDIL